MRISCSLAQDQRGRRKPSFMLNPAATRTSLSVEGDAVQGRVVVEVETDHPASILACEGVEPSEG